MQAFLLRVTAGVRASADEEQPAQYQALKH